MLPAATVGRLSVERFRRFIVLREKLPAYPKTNQAPTIPPVSGMSPDRESVFSNSDGLYSRDLPLTDRDETGSPNARFSARNSTRGFHTSFPPNRELPPGADTGVVLSPPSTHAIAPSIGPQKFACS